MTDLLGQLRAWVLRQFGKQFGQITPAQLRALAVSALKAQARETGGRYIAPVRFSVGGGKYIVPVKPLRQASNFAQAREAAKEFQGKVLTNQRSGLKAVVSRNNLDKMLSGKSVSKSESASSQANAVANVDKLFEQAIYGWNKPNDRSLDVGVSTIHRIFAPMVLTDGRILLAKMTIKESVSDKQGNNLYTVEAVEFSEDSSASQWVTSELQLDGQERTNIRSTEDITYNNNIPKSGTKSNIQSVMKLADEIEAHNQRLSERSDNRKYSISGAGEKIMEVTPARVAEELRGQLTDLKPHLLKVAPLNYFGELKRPNMVGVDEYLKTKRALDAYRGKKHAEADKIAQEWLKLAKFGKKNIQNLSDLMHESTLKGIDPSKSDAETKARQGYDALRREVEERIGRNSLSVMVSFLYIPLTYTFENYILSW